MADMLTEALRLRKLGFAVHWLRSGSKIPIENGWATCSVMSEAELKKSYIPGNNLGFRPGKWSVVDGGEVVVLDVDIRGGERYAAEAYAAAATMLGDSVFDVHTGSIVGRHRYLKFPLGKSPEKSATTLRESDIWISTEDGSIREPNSPGARPAWLIELLSTGKNVVMPPSIHPDTGMPYKFTNSK